MLDEILAAIGGAASGGMKGYSWAKDYEQADCKIEQDGEIKRLQTEIRLMLESMKETGRNERWATPSANVTTQQAGQTARNDADNATTVAVADARNDVTTRGQDLNFTLGNTRDTTVRRGQDITQQLGIARDATTRRGQDFGFTLGTDRNSLAREAETGRNTRATAANTLREREITQRGEIERTRRADPWSGVSFDSSTATEQPNGTGRPTAEPIEVIEKPVGGLPVQPRSPEAGADQTGRLEQQARSLIEQYRKEADPAKQTALRSQLARVRAELVKAQAKPGGQ